LVQVAQQELDKV